MTHPELAWPQTEPAHLLLTDLLKSLLGQCQSSTLPSLAEGARGPGAGGGGQGVGWLAAPSVPGSKLGAGERPEGPGGSGNACKVLLLSFHLFFLS